MIRFCTTAKKGPGSSVRKILLSYITAQRLAAEFTILSQNEYLKFDLVFLLSFFPLISLDTVGRCLSYKIE